MCALLIRPMTVCSSTSGHVVEFLHSNLPVRMDAGSRSSSDCLSPHLGQIKVDSLDPLLSVSLRSISLSLYMTASAMSSKSMYQ